MIGTEAVLRMFVPAFPCSCVIFPHPAINPDFPTISMGIEGKQIGKMWALKITSIKKLK
jgi:hypothetical protein